MQHSLWNLFRLPYIPKILSQIPASSSRYGHFLLIFIVALWAFSFITIVDNDLSIKSTFVAVVRLGIKLSIHDIIIHKSDQTLEGSQIFLHIWHLNIGNRTSWRNTLKLRFKGKFGYGINLFSHINMVRIGLITLVGHIFDLSESFLVNLREAVAKTFGWSSV